LDKLIIAFITGLTTGGLSCLAVQGGLLTSSLANQVENDIQDPYSKGTDNGTKHKKGRTQFAPSILIFLLAKLVAYSALGLLLGLIGQTFQLSVYARAFLQIAIGIFMLGNALRMLNVHPIFRFFVFEPPAFLRRLLRKKANNKRDSSLATSAFLGFLTIFIPCGVTQAMMAVALGTADPIQGAALMFAFTLGTSPIFFAVAYFTFQLGAKLEKHFMRFVAVILIILAVITIDSGITLAGSPVSLTRIASSVFSNSEKTEATPSTLEEQVYGMDGEN
jgi:sulfite exporter TauE/SafE